MVGIPRGRRLMQNGYNVSTLGPNKGKGALVKKLILATADPRAGAASQGTQMRDVW